MKISRLDAPRCQVGECPIWDAREGALYYLDIVGQKAHRYDPIKRTTRSWNTLSPATALVLREQGGALITLREGVHTLDFENGSIELLAQPASMNPAAMFNDGKVDRRGRFVFASGGTNPADPQPIGAIYSLGSDHVVREIDRGVASSNGPCWSPDNKTFYFCDTVRHTMFAYDYDIDTGRISNRRPFFDSRSLGGMPDGATVDRDGLVWIALVQAGKIVAVRPTGELERTIDMPVKLAVSLTFGGANLDVLYVTSIDPQYFGAPADDAAGYVYVIEGLGSHGLAETRYAG